MWGVEDDVSSEVGSDVSSGLTVGMDAGVKVFSGSSPIVEVEAPVGTSSSLSQATRRGNANNNTVKILNPIPTEHFIMSLPISFQLISCKSDPILHNRYLGVKTN